MVGAAELVMPNLLIIAAAIVSVVKAVLVFLKWYLRQKWQTRRLEMILNGVEEPYRESVIRAFGELENGGSDGRD